MFPSRSRRARLVVVYVAYVVLPEVYEPVILVYLVGRGPWFGDLVPTPCIMALGDSLRSNVPTNNMGIVQFQSVMNGIYSFGFHN